MFFGVGFGVESLGFTVQGLGEADMEYWGGVGIEEAPICSSPGFFSMKFTRGLGSREQRHMFEGRVYIVGLVEIFRA